MTDLNLYLYLVLKCPRNIDAIITNTYEGSKKKQTKVSMLIDDVVEACEHVAGL